MIDLHTHTLLSDGQLIPSEHIRRAECTGYRTIGISDHADMATMGKIIPVLLEAARVENELGRIRVIVGIELTHVRPVHIAQAAEMARKLGASYVIVHGQTIIEPVEDGTNLAAIEAGVDILAHPGLITIEEVKLAAAKGVRLEISGKAGHSLCNGHVARLAREHNAKIIFGSDSHEPGQFAHRALAERICMGAGMSAEKARLMFDDARVFADSLMQ
ncbi:MAG: histidinol phosphate phosphatase domain-containing protein [Planctomycetes bacterium]|jgi:putative hydrolase|nr:histidinol phosphate phosphatase domain-containing protein [Planctomycetota bacterium]